MSSQSKKSSPIRVKAILDPDGNVWVAKSDAVPGLALEAGHLEDLARELDIVIPELLALNNVSRTIEGDLKYRIEASLERTISGTA